MSATNTQAAIAYRFHAAVFHDAFKRISDPLQWVIGLRSQRALIDAGDCFRPNGDHTVESVFNRHLLKQDSDILQFDDEHTHAEVVAMWREVGRQQGWLS